MTAHIRDLTHMTTAEAAKALGRTPGAVRALAYREGVSMMLPTPATWQELVEAMRPEDAIAVLTDALDSMVPQHDELSRYLTDPLPAQAEVQRAVLERLLASRGQLVTREALASWAYGLRRGDRDPDTDNGVKMAIRSLRRRLRRGVSIKGSHMGGYSIHIREDRMSKTPEAAMREVADLYAEIAPKQSREDDRRFSREMARALRMTANLIAGDTDDPHLDPSWSPTGN